MNVNDFDKQIQGEIAGINLATVQGLAAGAAKVSDETKQDSIKKAKEKPAADFVPPSDQPILQPPAIYQIGHSSKGAASSAIQGSSGAVSLELRIDKPYSQLDANTLALQTIVGDITKKWVESVGEAADRRRAELSSPIYQSTEKYLHEIRAGEHDGTFSHAHVVQAAFVVGAPVAAFLAGANQAATASTTSFDTLKESMAATTQFMVDTNMAMTAGYIGGLFAQTAFLQAAWMTVGNADKAQNQGSNLAQAKNYADRIVKMCGDAAFTNYLSGLIAHHLEGGPEKADPQQVAKWVNYTKMGMMFHALAVLYKAQLGAWTPEEVAGQLMDVVPQLTVNPNADPLKKSDPRRPLLMAIARALIALPESERAQVITAMMNLLGSAKNLKDLENPTTILQSLFTDEAIQSRQITSVHG